LNHLVSIQVSVSIVEAHITYVFARSSEIKLRLIRIELFTLVVVLPGTNKVINQPAFVVENVLLMYAQPSGDFQKKAKITSAS
jgi:hypothetical protein